MMECIVGSITSIIRVYCSEAFLKLYYLSALCAVFLTDTIIESDTSDRNFVHRIKLLCVVSSNCFTKRTLKSAYFEKLGQKNAKNRRTLGGNSNV